MEISLTAKLRIVFQSEKDRHSAYETLIAYRNACNHVSQYLFDHDFEMKQSTLQSELYHDIRNRFGLKSQMTQSVFKTVIARYKTLQTQLRKQHVWDGYKKTTMVKKFRITFGKTSPFSGNPLSSNVLNWI